MWRIELGINKHHLKRTKDGIGEIVPTEMSSFRWEDFSKSSEILDYSALNCDNVKVVFCKKKNPAF